MVIRPQDMRDKLEERAHPLNPAARRRTMSLGDAAGLKRVGLHYTVVAPGDVSTELHRHHLGDEFVFVLSGSGVVELDGETVPIAAGDFIGLPARGPAHCLRNTGSAELVFLVGGDRPAFDVCDYPALDKRVYAYDDGDRRARDFVDCAALDRR
jgi:uncharacterized cupin superfamily protein